MELRAAARLNRDAEPERVCEDYLAPLSLTADERARFVRDAASDDAHASMASLHAALAGHAVDADAVGYFLSRLTPKRSAQMATAAMGVRTVATPAIVPVSR